MGPNDPEWLRGRNDEPGESPVTWTYDRRDHVGSQGWLDPPGYVVNYPYDTGRRPGDQPSSPEACQPPVPASPSVGWEGEWQPPAPPVTGHLIVDVWSDRADLWAADNLLTLAARVDGHIEVYKSGVGPITVWLLTAKGHSDAELLRHWEEIRREASGGASPGSDEGR